MLIDGFFRGLAAAGKLHPGARSAHRAVEVLRDVPYAPGGARHHLLDIYHPLPARRPGPWPVVLYIHGGGFRILSKDSHWVMGLAFAQRGYLVLNINYRLAPRFRFPAALEDACAAFRWAQENARGHGGDPGRVIVAGESAGANLATSLVLCCCYRRDEAAARSVWETGCVPRAALPSCGLLQVSDPRRFGRRRRLPRCVTDRLEQISSSYLPEDGTTASTELADPLLVLERGQPPDRPLPAFHAAVGTRDPILDDTRRLKAALDRLGVPCEARYIEGEPHAFNAFAWRRGARAYWREVYAFLDRVVPAEP
jgi:acetyl esterase